MTYKVMSNSAGSVPLKTAAHLSAAEGEVSVHQIFLEFLLIGATSFGGSVVAYLRSGLVAKRGWLNDGEFVELLSISETLPGLNSANMAVLVGDRMCGIAGAMAAICGLCLPAGLFMYVVAIGYHVHGDRPLIAAMLKGVAAAAVGLVLATVVQLSKKSLAHTFDLVFIVLTVIGVHCLHQSVPRVLSAVGILAMLWYRPRSQPMKGGKR
jgi:chromate transporter